MVTHLYLKLGYACNPGSTFLCLITLENCLASLCLSFLIYKMKIRMASIHKIVVRIR